MPLILPSSHPALPLVDSIVKGMNPKALDMVTQARKTRTHLEEMDKLLRLAGTVDVVLPEKPDQTLVENAITERAWVLAIALLDRGASLPASLTGETVTDILLSIWQPHPARPPGDFGVTAATSVFLRMAGLDSARAHYLHPIRILTRYWKTCAMDGKTPSGPSLDLSGWLQLMEKCGLDLEGMEIGGVWRPISRAVALDCFEVVDALMTHGVRLMVSDDDGRMVDMVAPTHPRRAWLEDQWAAFVIEKAVPQATHALSSRPPRL